MSSAACYMIVDRHLHQETQSWLQGRGRRASGNPPAARRRRARARGRPLGDRPPRNARRERPPNRRGPRGRRPRRKRRPRSGSPRRRRRSVRLRRNRRRYPLRSPSRHRPPRRPSHRRPVSAPVSIPGGPTTDRPGEDWAAARPSSDGSSELADPAPWAGRRTVPVQAPSARATTSLGHPGAAGRSPSRVPPWVSPEGRLGRCVSSGGCGGGAPLSAPRGPVDHSWGTEGRNSTRRCDLCAYRAIWAAFPDVRRPAGAPGRDRERVCREACRILHARAPRRSRRRRRGHR